MSALNKTRVVTIICWAISAVALLGLIAWVLASGLFGFGTGWDFGIGTFEPVGEHSVSADNIEALSIDWTSGRVYIGRHSGNEIQITEFARRTLRDGEHLRLNTDGGTLTIEFTERYRFFGGNTLTKQLEVLIPYAYSESFERFYINTTSGRIAIRDIEADVFTAATTSGRIELNGIAAQALSASTTSGRIELLDARAEDIQLRTTSGRIEVRDAQAQTLRTHTTSGRHALSGSFHEVNARSTSGRLEITSTIVPNRLTAHASSGRIEITVPNEGTISVQYSTGSGRFTSTMPVVTHAGADAQFDLSTGSGRISIYTLAG